MRISYTRLYGALFNSDEKIVNKSLKNIIHTIGLDHQNWDTDQSELKRIEHLININIEFTEKLINTLYEKGVLNNTDIKSLVNSIDEIDESEIFEIKLDKE